MSDKLFQNYTRGSAKAGVEQRETSVLTGQLQPLPQPEQQKEQPMHVRHVPNKD